MHPFALSRADDLAKAIAAHAMDGQLAFIAGGTDLLGLMKDRAALPERLLDINGLPDMARIEALPDGGLRIGALARMSDVAADLEVRRRFPVIAESLLFAASGQLRNMASIGGNIMQRTRCAYFRDDDDLPCNKRRPGSGCSALHGLNRNHAIFGWSDACVATHPSDLAVALAALDAVVIVRGPRGRRLIQFADFHRLPGSAPERDNVLERGDLIVAIEVPAAAGRSRLALPQGSRPPVLRVRAGVRSGGGRDRRQAHSIGAARHGRRRAQALAPRRRRKRVARRLAGRQRRAQVGDRQVLRRCSPARAQRVQGRACAARRFARAANRGSTRMNAIGQPISRVDGRLQGDRRRPVYG